MLANLIEMYKGTADVAPIAEGVKNYVKTSDLDCNCVSGNCTNCD